MKRAENRVRRTGAAWCAVFLAASSGCRRSESSRDQGASSDGLVRGDLVVVERAAAEFFQGRVLAVAEQTLRIQTTEDGEPVVVARSDAYRVPGSKPKDLKPGSPGICNDAGVEWHPCRIERRDGSGFLVRLISASTATLPDDRILAPTPVTALNVRRRFERLDLERRFDESAQSAGTPLQPHGWLPEPREPVIARRQAEWYSAHVDAMLGDGGVRVRWDGDEHPEAVATNAVVPIPPFAHGFAVGDFVLVRPATAAEPWRRVRIEAIGSDQAVLVDKNAGRLRMTVRELVPLSSSEAR